MSGRLTLTWANKEKALLSHGETGYEWVDRDDPRAREVRLLDEVGRVGEVAGTASDNLLIRGDSLDALRALVHSPEYAAAYRGKVKLVYIDPPFNTGQAFEHYDDSLEHSVWLGMMRERLVLIRDLLAPDGSVWVHLDDAEMAYCRVQMDEVFGRQNFVATVIWEKADTVRNDATRFSGSHDLVTVFARELSLWRAKRLPRSPEMDKVYRNPDSDPRGPWLAVPLQGPNIRPNLTYAVISPRTGREHWPPDGGCWRRSESDVLEMISDDRIYFGKDGNGVPQIKKFLTEVGDRVPSTVWPVGEVGGNRQSKGEMRALFPTEVPFATPKPERFLERVLQIATNPGDIVLDGFAGSGTTAAVAHKMGRRWVTAELSENTTDTFTKPRLEKVVAGEDPGGITESAGWTGGGGFRDLRVAASAWQVISDDHGTVALQADDVNDATLARSVAAQLGYLPVDSPVWAGAKGRSRLAVVSGVVDAVAVADIAAALDEGETAVIAALAATHDAESTLREINRGSRVLRLPIDLFPRLGTVTR
jgi:adenine-specific DNA-methyltransferase